MGTEIMAEGASAQEVATSGAQTGSGVSLEQKSDTQPTSSNPGIPSSVAALSQLGAVTPENPAKYISSSAKVVAGAESTGPQLEGKIPQSYIILGKIYNRLGQATPQWLTDAVEKKKAAGLQGAFGTVVAAAQLTDSDLKEFLNTDQYEDLKDRLLPESQKLIDEMFNPEEPADWEELQGVLSFVRDDIRRAYEGAHRNPVAQTDTDSWYSAPITSKTREERIKMVKDMLENYDEDFWGYGQETLRRIFGDTVDIEALRDKYEGAARYLAGLAAVSIIKELKGQALVPPPVGADGRVDRTRIQASKAEFSDYYLLGIKSEINSMSDADRARRKKERERASPYEKLKWSEWRERFNFNWAENAEELRESVEIWLDFFQQGLAYEAEDKVYESITRAVTNAHSALEQARIRIGLPADSMVVWKLRNALSGRQYMLGGVRELESKKGFDYYIKERDDFAHNMIGYQNEVMTEGVFLVADRISERNGAIFKGGPPEINKPLPGETKDLRLKEERDLKEYAATHELYIQKKDFKEAREATEADIIRIRAETEKLARSLGLNPEEKQAWFEREVSKVNHRYTWGEEDPIQELLLEDARGLAEADELSKTDPEKGQKKRRRVLLRTGHFQGLKEWLDKQDITPEEKEAGETRGLDGLSPDERRDRIRKRIRTKITETKQLAALKEIDAMPDQAAQDQAYWKWVRDYNRPREERHHEISLDKESNEEPWYPSLWDMERLCINVPEDLADRALSRSRFKAMIEEINDPLVTPYQEFTDDQVRSKIIEEMRAALPNQVRAEVVEEMNKLEAAGKQFSPDEASRRYREKMQEGLEKLPETTKERLEDVMFAREQRAAKAERDFKTTVNYYKFLGVEARWGGLTSREVDGTGKVRLIVLTNEAKEILGIKIDREEAVIEGKVELWAKGFEASHPLLNQAELAAEITASNPHLTPEELAAEIKAAIADKRKELTAAIVDKAMVDKRKELTEMYEDEKTPAEIEKKLKIWEEVFNDIHRTLTPEELAAEIAKEEAFQRKHYQDKYPGLEDAEIDTKVEQKVEKWRLGFEAMNPTVTGKALEEKTNKERRKLRRNSPFAATLGLREVGLANDLPIWNYYYYGDVAMIGAFAELVGYTDDEKGELVDLLERGRREMEAVLYYQIQKHMEGRILKVQDEPDLVYEDEDGYQIEAHEESQVRPRVINEGGEQKLRRIFESREMHSTSGGVKTTDLIAEISDLGVFDELWEHGCWDLREWVGFIKQRTKHEYRLRTYYNTREMADSISYIERLGGAWVALKFLTGGEVQGQGMQPGVLNEVMKGAWRDRYEFLDPEKWIASADATFAKKTPSPGEVAAFKKELKEKLDKDATFNALTIKGKDKLVELGGDIIEYLRRYMAARNYLRNKAGYAPGNWWYDNELIARAYFRELEKRAHIVAVEGEVLGKDEKGDDIYAKGGEIIALLGGEELGDQGQSFAVEGRTKAAIKIFESVLRGSTYEIPDEKVKRKLERQMRRAEKRIQAKRTALVSAILPVSDQAAIKAEMKKLTGNEVKVKAGEKKKEEDKGENEKLEDLEAEMVVLVNGKIGRDSITLVERKEVDRKAIDDKLKEVKAQNKKIATLKANINRMSNQAIQEELQRQVDAGNFTNQFLLNQITGRRSELEALHTTPRNIEWEINRLINDYIDRQLIEQVPGDWPARLAKENYFYRQLDKQLTEELAA